MTSDRWRQLETLFQAALERPEAERAAWLVQACADNPARQHEVEKLLAALAAADNFLETAAAEKLGLASRPANAQPGAAVGQHIGHYEIRAALGAGGMGEVYLAHDARLERLVAIKLLPAQFSHDAAWVERFTREARAASALNHPNILTIYEIGEDAGTPFMAAEYIAGQTLRQKLAAGRLPLRECLDIAGQIAHALSAAHAAGIIHRDIKPENVMVRPDGLVKVLDFGLAKLAPLRNADWGLRNEEVETLPQAPPSDAPLPPNNPQSPIRIPQSTIPGLVMGTRAYLSPEQGRHEELDARSDIFSLGVVLCELLTGARPATDAPEAAPEPADITEPVLARIVTRALAQERDRRYQNAADLQADLARFAQTLEDARPARWRKQLALAAALVLLSAFGLWLWQTRRATNPARPAFRTTAAHKLTDLPGEELFPSLTPDGQSVVFASRHHGNWDIYRQSVGARVAVNLTAGAGKYDGQPACSPDGARLAFRSSRNGGGVFLMNSDGSNVTQLTSEGFNPAWSPDGREVAFNDDNIHSYEYRNTYPSASRLWAVNVATKARRVISARDAVQANWSPSGKRLAFWGEQAGGHRDIWTVAADGGSAPLSVTDDADIDWNPVWSPTGEHLYFLSNRGGEMNLWRVAIDENTGRLRGAPEPATLPSNHCQHVSFARQGSALVYGQSTHSENLWQIGFDPARGQVRGAATPLTQGLKRYTLFSLAPDEQSFVYLARGEPQQDLFIADLNGLPRQRLTDDSAQDIIPRWSPDGQWIAFISDRGGKYEIWKVRPDGAGLAQMTHEPGREVIAPVWSPDSGKLLYQIRNVNSYIIDATRPGTAQTPHSLAGQPPPGFLPYDWSPDGNHLVGWQPVQGQRTMVVYSFAQQRYERFNIGFGVFPVWLNDNRRVLFRQGGSLFLLDRLTGKWRNIFALTQPKQIGHHALARDNRRIYFTEVSSEADIWLLSLN